MSLLREDTNMGTMTRKEAFQFFEECKAEVGTDCTMAVVPGGSFYNDLNKELCIDPRDLEKVRWEVKETILHEMAHHLTPDQRDSYMHGKIFYGVYVGLVKKFMASTNKREESVMGKDKVIGMKPCWACGTELPHYQVPRGCELACALSLREYPQSDGEMYYLCDTHKCILWDKEQRDLCLEELKIAQQN